MNFFSKEIIILVILTLLAPFILRQYSNRSQKEEDISGDGSYILRPPILVYYSGILLIILLFVVCWRLIYDDPSWLRAYITMFFLFGAIWGIMILYYFSSKTEITEQYLIQKPILDKEVRIYREDIEEVYIEIMPDRYWRDTWSSDLILRSKSGLKMKIHNYSSWMEKLYRLLEQRAQIKQSQIKSKIIRPFQKDTIL